MREFLQVFVPLVHDGEVDHRGAIFECHTTVARVGPPTDVLVAAMGSQMLELAGRLADGTIVSWTGPNTIRDHVIPTITRAAAEHGRPDPRIAAVFSVCVTDDVEGARAAVHEWFEFHGRAPSYQAMLDREGVASASDVALIGDEAEVTKRIQALADIGVTDLVVGEALPGERTRRLLAGLTTASQATT
jgi:alkanesulfonate monooxygenase SsuD/methylene tetrahydromethanopterin reductase-like flavin-dependent oxidoreductase (luciferase family)